MGGKSSSSASNSETTQTDARSISSVDSHDTSTTYTDQSSVSIVGADALGITQANAELMRTISSNQADMVRDVSASETDAMKAVAAFGADGFSELRAAFTNVSTTAANNAAAAWTHTVDASAELMDRLAAATSQSNDSARMVAQAAIASYQPSENKSADTFKYAAIAGAVVVALALMRKA